MPRKYEGEPELSKREKKIKEMGAEIAAERERLKKPFLPNILGPVGGKGIKAAGAHIMPKERKRMREALEEGAAGAGLKKAKPKPKLPKHWRNKPFI